MPSYTCQYCKKQFNFGGTWRIPKFCNLECFKKYNESLKIHKICPQCGNQFVCNNPNRKFCSPKCSNRFNQPKDPTKKAIFICEWCNKQFEEWEYRHPRFCSKKCAGNFGARQPKLKNRNPLNYNPKPCPICNKIFIGHKKFCSEICENENQAIQKMGKNNPNWVGGPEYKSYGPNWERQKRKAKKRDNHTCQKCGYKSGGNRLLDVHHIIPFRFFDDYKIANKLDNLITLCRKCHIQTEILTRKTNQT